MSSPKPKKPKKAVNPVMIRRVVGHSMLPVLPPGTLVIALTWLSKPLINSVVIIEHEGKEKIKRIQDVKHDEIFVVGDHEDGSTDSRHFGWVNVATIRAHVVWPKTGKP